MRVIYAKNVNDALMKGLLLLRDEGIHRQSRNGGVHVMPVPVTTVYSRPEERVLFDTRRDANPFFHLMEALWMLAGRNDAAFVAKFAKNMLNYSDDGVSIWGAYGWRWRSFFQIDQIDWAIKRLRKNKEDRRCYIAMWDAYSDPDMAKTGGKDVPCNVGLQFQVTAEGKLDMTVFNRSNDIIWGAYGANAVHFSMLQEYVARALGIPVGIYYQVSNNYHAYDELYDKMLPAAEDWESSFDTADMYQQGTEVFPLIGKPGYEDRFNRDLVMFLDEPMAVGFQEPFFRKIAKPMLAAHTFFKLNTGLVRYTGALEILEQMPTNNDWRAAAEEWIKVRQDRFIEKQEAANVDD